MNGYTSTGGMGFDPDDKSGPTQETWDYLEACAGAVNERTYRRKRMAHRSPLAHRSPSISADEITTNPGYLSAIVITVFGILLAAIVIALNPITWIIVLLAK